MHDTYAAQDPATAMSTPVGDGLVDLVRSVAHGDQAAFASLYDRIGGTVFARCLGVTGDPSRAEAVSRDTMLEVWRTAPMFDTRHGTVLTWAFGIADCYITGNRLPARGTAQRT